MGRVYEVGEGKKPLAYNGVIEAEKAVNAMVAYISRLYREDKTTPDIVYVTDDGTITRHAYFEDNPDDGPTVVVRYMDACLTLEHVQNCFDCLLNSDHIVDSEYYNA